MTDFHVRHLNEIVEERSEETREAVLQAVSELGKPQTRDIKRLLDEKARKKIEEKYQLGEISNHEIMKEIERITITKRTIIRKLNKLKEQGLIEYLNNTYCLTDLAKYEIRAYAMTFSQFAFPMLVKSASDKINKMNPYKISVKELITLFGSYVFLCLIEAARPVYDNFDFKKGAHISVKDKEKVARTWLERTLDPKLLFSYFRLLIMNPAKRPLTNSTFSKVNENGISVFEIEKMILDNLTIEFKATNPRMYTQWKNKVGGFQDTSILRRESRNSLVHRGTLSRKRC